MEAPKVDGSQAPYLDTLGNNIINKRPFMAYLGLRGWARSRGFLIVEP